MAGPPLRAAVAAVASGLDDNVAALKRLVLRLPFLQVIGNVIARAEVGYRRDGPPFPMPLALEYVTWLYLTASEPFDIEGKPIGGDDFEELERLLGGVLTKSMLSSMSELHRLSDRGVAEQGKADLEMRALMHENYIRQSGYPQHLRDQGEALFAQFDADLRRLGLVPYATAASVLSAINQTLEAQIGQRVAATKAAADDYLPAVKDPVARARLDPEAQQLVKALGKDVGAMLGSWHTFFLAECYYVDVPTVAQASGVPEEDVHQFLEAFSLPFGQAPLLGGRPGRFEPQRRAPIVRMPAGQYLAHLAPYLQWTIRERYDEALADDPTVGEPYQEHRARYLEDEAVRLLASASPHAAALRSCEYWFDDGEGLRQFEVDGLVFIDSLLFIVEAKAGRLSPKGRRGRSIRELRRLVSEAQEQAARVERYIRSTQEAVFTTEDGRTLTVTASEGARVILANPTIEPLHAFVTRWSDLESAGIAKAKPWVWSVTVTDLRAIVETVETAGQLAHFLKRREQVEDLNVVAAEELDLFGHYLDQGLYLDEVRRDRPDMASIDSWTDALDAHFERGEPVPRMALPAILRELVHKLAKVGPPGWIEATDLLLEGSSSSMEAFAGSVESRRARVASGATEHTMARFALGGDLLGYMASREIDTTKLQIYVSAIRRYHSAKRAIGIAESASDPGAIAVFVDDLPLDVDPAFDALAHQFVDSMSSSPQPLPPKRPYRPSRPRSERRAFERLRQHAKSDRGAGTPPEDPRVEG